MATRTQRESPQSLLVEILDWLLAPLILLWPLSVVVTFWIANVIANIPYDRALSDSISALAQQVRFDGGQARVALPAGMSALLRTDELDTVSFQIRGLRGEVLAGDGELAEVFPEETTRSHVVYFRDEVWHHEPVRIAYMFIYAPDDASQRRVLIQVGETLNKRQKLANEIIAGIIVPQFFLFPFVAVLAWFGLHQGTRALEELSARLRSRRSSDLSRIETRDVPEEVVPLVEAFNGIIDRLTDSMRAQERFIADAAHQLRTPLAGLRTQLELALRESDPQRMHDNLERLHASVERTAHLVSQLLALARSQAGAEPRFEHVDVNAVLRDVTRDFVPRALDKRIDLGFEEQGRGWIEGNALLLREVFSNLLDNAIRYTEAGGKVTARVRAGEDAVVVEVEDNGAGIDAKDRELVFERFYRAADNTTPGSGLGLAIVRSIAGQHRATVAVAPNPHEHGSLFTVTFPAAIA